MYASRNLALCQVRGAAFAFALELVVALPGHPAIFVGAVPDLRAEVVTAVAADQATGKNGLSAVATAQRLSPGHLFLHPVEQERVDDCFVTVLHIILRRLALIDLPLFCEEIDREALPFHFTTDIFSAKSRVCICKHFANKLPSPAVRRCNSFCFYGIAAAIGLRHTNGNISVTISSIRPECFSFSLPLLQFQKRFLASSAKND